MVYLSVAEQKKLLSMATLSGEFTLASGRTAKYKFDFDLIKTNSKLFKSVISALSQLIKKHFVDFDAIITVANGATRLGEPLSRLLNVKHISTNYKVIEGEKVFQLNNLEFKSAVIIDDVFTAGTNATKVANCALVTGAKIIGLAVVLNRSGDLYPKLLYDIPVFALINKELN